jgi:hypothetical protein
MRTKVLEAPCERSFCRKNHVEATLGNGAPSFALIGTLAQIIDATYTEASFPMLERLHRAAQDLGHSALKTGCGKHEFLDKRPEITVKARCVQSQDIFEPGLGLAASDEVAPPPDCRFFAPRTGSEEPETPSSPPLRTLRQCTSKSCAALEFRDAFLHWP